VTDPLPPSAALPLTEGENKVKSPHVGAGFSRRGVGKDASRPAPAKAGAYERGDASEASEGVAHTSSCDYPASRPSGSAGV